MCVCVCVCFIKKTAIVSFFFNTIAQEDIEWKHL